MQLFQLDSIDITIPLVIDLDGTLLKTDSLYECLMSAVLKRKVSVLSLFFALRKGRPYFKYTVVNNFKIRADGLCYRSNLLSLIKSEKGKGRGVCLVTAANQKIADAVQYHLQLFDQVQGSNETYNMKGKNKLNWLREKFSQGFIYAGDHPSDIHIWKESKAAILVGKGKSQINQVKKMDIPVFVIEDEPYSKIREWVRLLRIHQWVKNVLIFLPLFLAHVASNFAALVMTFCVFIAFNLVASSTYIINDLCDIESDRRHKTKRFRPLAAGTIEIQQAVIAGILLLLAGGMALVSISPAAFWCSVFYATITVIYSLKLKRVPLLDVTIIGALFTNRVIIGAVSNNLPLSPWLNAFSALFFFSLALAKRHAEVMALPSGITKRINGRGYLYADWPLTLVLGIASSVSSIVIMLLFLTQEQMVNSKYNSPDWLLLEPVCVFIWTLRIWLLSHRKQLDGDPVIFALKDPVSLGLAVAAVTGFLLANY